MKTTLCVILVLFCAGCPDSLGSRDPEVADQRAVSEQQELYAQAQPIPRFDWSQERDIVIQLYRARNSRVATHTVWRSDTGVIEGDCPSIAYPTPYDTSLTNPWQVSDGGRTGHYWGVAIGQAEPNGIFASQNSIATWVRCVIEDETGTYEAPIYIESKVTAYPYPVRVDYDANRVHRVEGRRPALQLRNNEPE